MVTVASRTGREFQRYNQGSRQVVGCIPYRRTEPNHESPTNNGSYYPIEDIEVLLISSQKSPRLMFPKGGWEVDESMEQAALRETFEEAGVEGLVERKLGQWSFRSNSQDTFHEGHMFPMFVTDEQDVWPEQNVRQRVWLSVKEAREVCVHSWMKAALDILVERLKNLQRKEDGNPAPCSVEFSKESGRGIVAQSGEEEVDCCLVS